MVSNILSHTVIITMQNCRLLSALNTSKYENPLLQVARLLTWIFQKLENMPSEKSENPAKYDRITPSILKVTSVLGFGFFLGKKTVSGHVWVYSFNPLTPGDAKSQKRLHYVAILFKLP